MGGVLLLCGAIEFRVLNRGPFRAALRLTFGPTTTHLVIAANPRVLQAPVTRRRGSQPRGENERRHQAARAAASIGRLLHKLTVSIEIHAP